ncbi:MAG: hypothetical protein KC592_02030 [Nitrospira sp.]|nr:hypothetical protein [Nitrospira sp.]
MPKMITAKRHEDDTEKAQEFVRTNILLPASLLGLISVVVGVIALGFQFWAGTYGWETFTYSSALIIAGVLVGIVQTKYQQYLLREFPGHFASRMKAYSQRSVRKAKKAITEHDIEHRGRGLVPLWYFLGIVMFFALSGLAVATGFLQPVAAFALPWAGYFWAKLFFWKGVVLLPERKKR